MHWADVVADKLLESGKEHVISSGITPSGPIHLGSMREILTADAVVRSVNHKGGKAKLVYIADNADPLRKVYPFLDNEKYEEFVGRDHVQACHGTVRALHKSVVSLPVPGTPTNSGMAVQRQHDYPSPVRRYENDGNA